EDGGAPDGLVGRVHDATCVEAADARGSRPREVRARGRRRLPVFVEIRARFLPFRGGASEQDGDEGGDGRDREGGQGEPEASALHGGLHSVPKAPTSARPPPRPTNDPTRGSVPRGRSPSLRVPRPLEPAPWTRGRGESSRVPARDAASAAGH